jgi:N-acetylneuraminic acid mutarotase
MRLSKEFVGLVLALVLLLLGPAWAASNPLRATQAREDVPELVQALNNVAPDKSGAFSAVDYRDAGAFAIDAPSGDSVPPGPILPRGTVHNYGDSAVQIPARYDIYYGESLVYSSTDSVQVAAGANGTITFDQWVATGGSYLARLTTMLVGDQNPANDTLSARFFVIEPGHDFGIIRVWPHGVVDTLPITPSVRVRNFGSYIETFWTYFQIRDSETGSLQYDDSVHMAGLAPGLTVDLSFSVWGGHHPEGWYCAKCWAVTSEGITTDTVRYSFQVIARIVDVGIISINFPDAVDSGTVVNPSMTVCNHGNSPADFDVTLSINVSPQYLSTVTVAGLSPNKDTVLNSFAPWPAIQRGVWTVRCSLQVVDQQFGDTMSGTVTVNVHDLSAKAIVAPVGGVPPITMTPKAKVRNYGTQRESCTVTFSINSSPPYTDTKDLTGLPVGCDTVLAFADWPASNGSYTARCSTYLANDQVPGNEVVTTDFQVGMCDVGVTAILLPGDIDTSAAVTPSATVQNFAGIPSSFPVRFTIANGSDVIVYTGDTTVYSLAGGSSANVTFPPWPKPHAPGWYAAKCSTMLEGDAGPDNDAATGLFRVGPDTGGGNGPWTRRTDLPPGDRHKTIKDGGALCYGEAVGVSDTGYVYALKGNNTCEFYRYSIADSVWTSRDSIPAIGRSGRTKGLRKGSSLTFTGDGKIYATKGNNSCEFWQYDPTRNVWTEMANEVPTGGKACKEGTSSASVTFAGTNYVYLLKGSGTYEFYRYNADAGTWETMANAPTALSHRSFKTGSSITYDGGDTIYCMKGSYNEFFAYSISNDKWVTLETLPRKTPIGTRKTKVKDGSGIAFMDRTVYALKGANTNEFWTYPCDSHRWYWNENMPKKVKGGGALVAATDGHFLYAFRGSNTLEFWRYDCDYCRPVAADGQPKDVQVQSAIRSPQFALSITPNPFTTATVISCCLPRAGNIRLRLYDVTGKLVSTLASGYHPAGSYSSQLTANSSLQKLAAGIYILRLDSEGNTTTQKVIIE